jgi:1-acyl-sn-glycerol-3-phosphate acyltransferase
MKLLRRAITVPLATGLMIGILMVWPVLLVVGGVVGLITRSSLPVRTLGVVMAYALLELRALWQLMRGGQDRDEFVRDLLKRTHTVGRRTLDVDVQLDEGSPTPEQIPREEPVIVLARHCGPGDTLLIAWLLNTYYRLKLRIVLKALLRCEPVIDLAGDLGCLYFLGHRGDKARRQIHNAAQRLRGGQALLLFPEGGNFTWARWQTAILKLRSSGRLREARRAWRQTHTLPPRTGGAAAALSGAPSAAVLVLTHTGFSPDGRDRAWWRLPMNRRLLVRTVLIPPTELPAPDQLGPWLERTWSEVDAWVADHANGP